MDKKDIAVRAAKTFVQAFFGVLVPELAAILNGGFTDLPTFWKAVAPFVAAALAAGISAAWNGLQAYFTEKKEMY
ncbi:MAG: hypothetical protein IJK23_10040 [Clostridia bacterium]|nr:hypothetical protein [Clostridia bacterium]